MGPESVVRKRTQLSRKPASIAKEIPAFVKSWATAQTGKDSAHAFTKVGEELWMETLPRTTLDEICAAFEKFGLKLRALSIMPTNILTKDAPFNHAEFIAEVVRQRKTPNLLARGNAVNWKKISATIAAIFFIALLGSSTKIFLDYRAESNKLDATKISVSELKAELELKQNIDADVAELNRLNQVSAAQNVSPTKFNLLLNLGKIAGGDVRLTKIRCEENFLEVEGESATPDAVKNYLSRVKSSVAQSARLENSSERDDGEIFFVIRAAL